MSENPTIGCYVRPGAKAPIKATSGSVAADLSANVPIGSKITVRDPNNKVMEWPVQTGKITVPPYFRVLIPTGVFFEFEDPWYGLVIPRSSSWKTSLTLINNVGLIDTDYRGEVFAPMINLSDKNVFVEDGERIVQMIFKRREDDGLVFRSLQAEPGMAPSRSGGLGSTGKQ